jgi:SSS family transporter
MLLFFIGLYIAGTLAIGFFSSRMVKSSTDFALAGRSLPLSLASAALFATWFGSETILGAPSEFVKKGALGIIEDPLGAALCLFLVGIFFARKMYRMKIVTLCDFFRIRFGAKAEWISSLCMIPSYFGWVAAQLIALGIIFNVLTGVPVIWGTIFGALAVLFYTYVGGMWAISITDFFQTIIIIAGLGFLAYQVLGEAQGFEAVVSRTPPDFFRFYPKNSWHDYAEYLAAWIAIGLGSIPQQDVFQRVMAAKSEKTAVTASYIGGTMYVTIALLPLIVGLAASQVYPELMAEDAQFLLPNLVMRHANIGIQILFFGALLSAIMSTASGGILAPSVIIAENIIKHFRKNSTDKTELLMMRISVVIVTILSTGMAMMNTNIHDLVKQSSVLSLVALFIPMAAGMFWHRASGLGAILSMILGMAAWLIAESYAFYPSLIGTGASILGMAAGSLLASEKFELKSLYE